MTNSTNKPVTEVLGKAKELFNVKVEDFAERQ
jgi:NADH-quinone oxidoreductase subunit C